MTVKLYLPINPATIPSAQHKGVRVVKGIPMFFTKPEMLASNARIRSAVIRELLNMHVPIVVRKLERTVTSSKKNVLMECVRDTISRDKPVKVTIAYCFPFTSTHTKAEKTAGFKWKVERPDTDNLTKSVLDVLTDCQFWHDDSQVVRLELHKCMTATPPCVFIEITTEVGIPRAIADRMLMHFLTVE